MEKTKFCFSNFINAAYKKSRVGSIIVWGCFSYNGMGNLIFVENNLTSISYQIILSKNLITSSKNTSLKDFTFQQDNAPPHRSKLLQNYFIENQIKVLPWPSQSPDLNPIENIWSLISKELCSRNIKSIKDLKSNIQDIWINISKDNIRKLVDSMPNRLGKVINNNGYSTNY